MHIKEIVISGFSSYRNRTVISALSPELNVIVGRNGSGKSNFFAAIRFVLSEDSFFGPDFDKYSVLHSGTRSGNLNAEVEIVFDNWDERFPTGGAEVRISRTLSHTRDEYKFDGKTVPKSEISSKLEAAGFTSSNPFYIIPQGRVTALTNATDAERLDLLLSVAGADVYDSKRADSIELLEESKTKLTQTTDRLDHIGQRLSELESEMEDLHAYLNTLNEKRSIEYTLLQQEADRIEHLLTELHDQQTQGSDRHHELTEQLSASEQDVAKRETEFAAIEQQLEMIEVEITDKERLIVLLSKEKAELDMEVQAAGGSADGDVEMGSAELDSMKDNLEQGQSQLEKLKAKITTIQNKITETRKQQTALKDTVDVANARVRALQVKKGRYAKFSNATERDQWLEAELNQFRDDKTTQSKNISSIEKDIKETEEKVARVSEDLNSKRDALGDVKQTVSKAEQDHSSLRRELDNLENTRSRLQLQQKKAEIKKFSIEKEADIVAKSLSEVLPYDTFLGIEAARDIAKDLGLEDKFYGTVAELITINEQFVQVAEIMSGRSLFHIVVDTPDTASKIMAQLVERQSGSASFIPLEKISGKLPRYPEGNASAEPLVNHIQTDPKFQNAVNMIFGTILVCRDLAIARSFADQFGLRTITLQGDAVDPRGSVTGGSIDRRSSGNRMSVVKAAVKLREVKVQKDENKAEAERLITETEAIQQKITKQHNLINRASIEIERSRASAQEARSVLSDLEHELGRLELLLTSRRDDYHAQFTNLEKIKTQINAYEQDLAMGFEQTLTAEEESEMAQLASQLKNDNPILAQISDELTSYEEAETESKIELNKKHAAMDKLKAEIAATEGSAAESTDQLSTLRVLQDELSEKITKGREDLEELKSQLLTTRDQHQNANEALDKDVAARDGLARSLIKHEKQTDKLSLKHMSLDALKADNTKKLRDLGQVTTEAFGDKYRSLSSSQLSNQLNEVNKALQGFDHVNKKAVEQHALYTEQLSDLRKREEQLEEDIGSISTLIEKLDGQKEQSVMHTFKMLAKAFENTFKNLVPHGSGSLAMKQSDAPTSQGFEGVSIDVSFDGNDHLRIEQLSGGQKSVCALALIFAIQVFDSAPFYIFDEIDANLDPQYRQSVASMVHTLSEKRGAQFICTTFRPELVHTADKIYGVSFQRGVSTMQEIDEDLALSFVDVSSATEAEAEAATA